MKKHTNVKNEKWTSADVVKCVIVFFINTIVLFAMYVIAHMLRSGFEDFVSILIDTSSLQLLLLIVLTVIVFALYFGFEERNFLKTAGNIEMIFLIIEISIIICFALGMYVNEYLCPLALPAILALFLTNRKNSIIVQIVSCILFLLIDSFASASQIGVEDSVLVFGFVSGIVAVYGMGKIYSRIELLVKSFLISIPTLLGVGLIILKDLGTTGIVEKLVSAFCSGPLAVAVFIVLLPVFEVLFKKVSCFKYAELTDHKSRLIKRLITEAPGTFNHSIVVSNIAEACATAIGEDAMLARTCAYYHDIGKLRRPEFFTENQADGKNPHDDLTPELSTNIIKSHTADGYSILTKHRLPKEIAKVCIEHHGTLPILYFYDKAKKLTDGEVDINQFCYSGPKPQSKISAIVMIADGSEAAARSLKDRSRQSVYNTVRKIVDDRLKLGQFDECEITIKELNIIIHTIVNNLTGIYHNRVEYPKVKLNDMR